MCHYLNKYLLDKKMCNRLKRKAVTQTLLCERPSKLLRAELRKHKIYNIITTTDVLNIKKKNFYRALSSFLPNILKSRNEVHNVLSHTDITNKNYQFLLHNDLEVESFYFQLKLIWISS